MKYIMQHLIFKDDTISNIFNAFQENVARCCEFWNYMDELDTKTWVLEPEKPTRKDCKRRIALSKYSL